MYKNNLSKNSIEKITQQIQIVANQLSDLAWEEKDKSAKELLSELYEAQSLINKALAKLCKLTTI